MTIRIHANAYKHGLTTDQIIAAFHFGSATARVRSRDRESDPPRWATIGIDREGREIELVFVMTETGALIFHANRCTNGFRRELQG